MYRKFLELICAVVKFIISYVRVNVEAPKIDDELDKPRVCVLLFSQRYVDSRVCMTNAMSFR